MLNRMRELAFNRSCRSRYATFYALSMSLTSLLQSSGGALVALKNYLFGPVLAILRGPFVIIVSLWMVLVNAIANIVRDACAQSSY